MATKIIINRKNILQQYCTNYSKICTGIEEVTHLQSHEYYLLDGASGKRLTQNDEIGETVECVLRLCGGKGGFGSMLRAIGAQIEKTTNREACRDLSGRRLRDINEEKRVRAWLEKQGEREREAEERKKRKIAKLLAVPKHEFKDEEYEASRAKLTEKVNDAFEEGLKQVDEEPVADEKKTDDNKTATKRKNDSNGKTIPKKKTKGALWIGDDISGTDSDDTDSDDETKATTSAAIKI